MKRICKDKEIFTHKNVNYIKSHCSPLPEEEKAIILNYLRHSTITAIAPGIAKDILTGETIDGPLTCMTDGVFEWRSDIIYYFEKYDIELSSAFLSYILGKKE